MRRAGLICGIAAAALVATVVVTAAGAAASRPATATSTAETLRFSVHFGPFFFNDLDNNGQPSTGDQIVFHDLLFRNGRQVGQDGGSCTVVNNDPLLASCTGTIQLPDGQIAFAWLNSPPPRKHLAITGGTGHFRTARGEGTLVEFASGPTGSLTLQLLL
jgi:allene oxide cyclase-like protein